MKELVKEIITRLGSEKTLPKGKTLDKRIKEEFGQKGVILDLRLSKHYEYVADVKVGLHRLKHQTKRCRLRSWDDRWQCYEYQTTWIDNNPKVGNTFWVKDKRYEVIEVLE
jgi:hypothetical protein